MKHKIIFSILFLTGCGAFVPVHNENDVTDSIKNTSLTIPLINSDKSGDYKLIGTVIGYSCKNKIWDPSATAEDATYQVKIEAVKRGATAITNLNCSEGAVSLSKNCWQSYTCQATALK